MKIFLEFGLVYDPVFLDPECKTLIHELNNETLMTFNLVNQLRSQTILGMCFFCQSNNKIDKVRHCLRVEVFDSGAHR